MLEGRDVGRFANAHPAGLFGLKVEGEFGHVHEVPGFGDLTVGWELESVVGTRRNKNVWAGLKIM